MLQEAKVSPIKTRLEKLAKSWFTKASNIENHPIQNNRNNYHYDPETD